jgi:hypothetical protein
LNQQRRLKGNAMITRRSLLEAAGAGAVLAGAGQSLLAPTQAAAGALNL